MNTEMLIAVPKAPDGRHVRLQCQEEPGGIWACWIAEEGLCGPHGEGATRKEAVADLIVAIAA